MTKKKTTAELVGERPSPRELAKLPRTPIAIVVDNVRSLDNVGMLFRLGELARLEHLYLTGYTGYPEAPGDSRPPHIIERNVRRITKTAVYALPHQPWSYHEDPVPLVEEHKRQSRTIIALEQTTSSIPYHSVPPAAYYLPLTLMLGHEREGIRPELLDLAHTIIEIPILGLGNSHNVATACGIVLYKILEANDLLSLRE